MHLYSKGCRILGLLIHALPLPPHQVLLLSLLPSPPCRGINRHMILTEHGGDSWQCGPLIGGCRPSLPELESESQGSCGCGHIQSCDPFSRDHLTSLLYSLRIAPCLRCQVMLRTLPDAVIHSQSFNALWGVLRAT